MEYCYFSKVHVFMRWLNRILTTVYVVLFAVVTVILLGEEGAWPTIPLAAVVFAAVIGYGVVFELYYGRKYQLSDKGIAIRYAGRFDRFYPWDSFGKICLCSIHFATRSSHFDQVIWCQTRTVQGGPTAENRKWTSTEYGFLHFGTVLQMEYTPERLAEFRRSAPCRIEDLRGKFY